jgi:hypothetical protein
MEERANQTIQKMLTAFIDPMQHDSKKGAFCPKTSLLVIAKKPFIKEIRKKDYASFKQ